MRDAGIIDYQSNVDADAFVANVGLAPYIQTVINVVRSMFYGEMQTTFRPD
jgi:hypothetical protein